MEIRPSLFDLLCREETRSKERQLNAQDYLQGVTRDVAELLNALNRGSDIDFREAPDVEKSTLNYGMPHMVGVTISSLQTQVFQQQVKQILQTFEPRLNPDTIEVVIMSESDRLDQIESVTMRIEAEVYLNPAPLHLVLESKLGIEDGRLSTLL